MQDNRIIREMYNIEKQGEQWRQEDARRDSELYAGILSALVLFLAYRIVAEWGKESAYVLAAHIALMLAAVLATLWCWRRSRR